MLQNLCNDSNIDCIMLQESSCTSSNLHQILQVYPMTEILFRGLLRGRPFGGVQILIRNNPEFKVKCLSASVRFVILLVEKTIVGNVYFPCTSLADFSKILLALLADIAKYYAFVQIIIFYLEVI